jgi:general secretion pathway protein G
MKRSSRKNAGFTLLEIMLVVCIIGLLIGMGVKMMGSKIDEAKIVGAKGGVENFKTALLMYQSSTGSYPTTEQGLKALVTKPEGVRNWRAQMETGQLIDAWNHEYFYLQPGVHNPRSYDVFSAGPDGVANTPDDLGNWESTTN